MRTTFGFVAFVLAIPAGPHASLAGQADLATLQSECATQLNLSPAGCTCIANTANDQLNDNQQALVAAMVTKNQARADEVRAQMTVQEISDSAEFMMTAPQLCGTQ